MAFLGGSAFAMARDVAEGYILLHANQLKRLTPEESVQLRFELERILSGLRSEQIASDDLQSLQGKNRRMSRLNSAIQMINNLRRR